MCARSGIETPRSVTLRVQPKLFNIRVICSAVGCSYQMCEMQMFSTERTALISQLFDVSSQFNFVGRILGPRGLTAKQLEAETGCKIMVRGKSSMRDKKKVGHFLFSLSFLFILYNNISIHFLLLLFQLSPFYLIFIVFSLIFCFPFFYYFVFSFLYFALFVLFTLLFKFILFICCWFVCLD